MKKSFLLFILFASLIFSLPMIRSGLTYDFGLGFWGPNGHDGVWHLALMNKISASGFPIENPVFAGENFSGYHWGFDAFAAALVKVFSLPATVVYFQLLPILFAFFLGFLGFKLAFLITKNRLTAFLFVFLNYFAGSFGWLVTLAKSGELGGESLFWAMQSISTLINPPYAMSLILMLLGLIFWLEARQTKKITSALFIGFIFGLLGLIKVYAGVLMAISLFCFWLYQFLFKKKKFFSFDFFVFSFSFCFLLLTFLLMGVFESSSSLIFKPFWFIHTLVESVDKFYFPYLAVLRINLAQRLVFYKLPFLLFLELVLLLIFLVGNLGSRFLGLLNLVKKVVSRKINDFDLWSLFFMFFALLLPLLFVQSGTTWNTIQFFYYFIFLTNFYFAEFLSRLFKKRKFFWAIILILLIIPTTLATLKNYLGYPPPAGLPKEEIEALNVLKVQKGNTVLSFPYDKYKKQGLATPIPLYLYETSAYVSAFSGKTAFLEDEMNLEITGYPWRERRLEVEKFFKTDESIWARGFLVNNQIDYIYLTGDQKLTLSEEELGIKMIFDNQQVKIYEVSR